MGKMDEQDRRIDAILGEDCERNTDNLKKYARYLKKTVEIPCVLACIQELPWEEPYVFGGWWAKIAYKWLKKKYPSYTDEFILLELPDPGSDDDDIYVKVERIADKKIFEMELSWLECTDKKHKNYQLLNDYAVWHDNY